MDVWEMFSELCRQVVEEQNVYLDINVTPRNIQMMLMPLYDEEEEEEGE